MSLGEDALSARDVIARNRGRIRTQDQCHQPGQSLAIPGGGTTRHFPRCVHQDEHHALSKEVHLGMKRKEEINAVLEDVMVPGGSGK